jgi:hypothetical protein
VQFLQLIFDSTLSGQWRGFSAFCREIAASECMGKPGDQEDFSGEFSAADLRAQWGVEMIEAARTKRELFTSHNRKGIAPLDM